MDQSAEAAASLSDHGKGVAVKVKVHALTHSLALSDRVKLLEFVGKCSADVIAMARLLAL